uniref:Uncharacterized protein n=1 Tax=Octactis speculum TaxID=3111310 RepID=A0A7S2HT86_9STRA|mmetsp:Transcript_9202/g.11825  ORF Transcript_9202/g.11825 Transcript_9202/m.11825 type:complete len:164 (+) Transcript_9202:51-542(+)|eukprot:CAMPEP_0185780818 /NCGR_PEP_ID=MMETSP1174-20130828/100245_1 /TAXON_ID=35687 /ORGANISM="Dictyocha speculum, Strain CCMP1381" /LENGTH=163 /DNA_ID=CAMNT_0028470515 /DNA_START=35 /DNA_END=526 /DNA_ORIENTATION=-
MLQQEPNSHQAKIERIIQAPAGSTAWLDTQATAFSLSDRGKVFRCCINWASQTAQQPVQAAAASSSRESIAVVATEGQWRWLEQSNVMPSSLLALAQAAPDAADIFEVVRCKSKTATACAGAVAALAAKLQAPACDASKPVKRQRVHEDDCGAVPSVSSAVSI